MFFIAWWSFSSTYTRCVFYRYFDKQNIESAFIQQKFIREMLKGFQNQTYEMTLYGTTFNYTIPPFIK